ncbi:tetratricopeptide repeat protein [Myxococcota bacterium]|nr:tetratricopeptide repeat protein [Myxococcota bacterium]
MRRTEGLGPLRARGDRILPLAAFAVSAALLVAGGCAGEPVSSERDRAHALFVQGDYEGALAALEALARAEPGEAGAEALLLAARIQRDSLRRPEDAARTCRDLVDRYPGTGAARKAAFLLGDVLEKDLLRPRKAIEAYRAAAADPEGRQALQARYRIGRCYRALEDPRQARLEWRKLVEEEGGGGEWRVPALLGIAESLEQEGLHDEAIRAYTDLRAQAGGTEAEWRAREGEARCLEGAGREAEALAAWRGMRSDGHPDPARVDGRIDALGKRKELRDGNTD